MRARERFVTTVGTIGAAAVLVLAMGATAAPASVPGGDVRLTNDTGGGYTSDYTLVTGVPYTDPTITECGRSRGRQNEPSVAVDPRNTSVLVGSSNDYCGVFNDGVDSSGAPIPSGPIWLGYYRSTDGGASFASSLVPGYPGDVSPYASRAQIRTASAGDPVLAWDRQGRLFAGSESSGDPAGTKKTFGDEWVATYENPNGLAGNTLDDGKEFIRSVTVAKGAAAPNLRGKFNDKTAIEVDRTGGSCDGTVYFAWSRFTNSHSNIYLSRSTDHGATWSNPDLLTTSVNDVQVPEVTVTGNGHVYVTWIATLGNKQAQTDAVQYAKSTTCGATFAPAHTVVTFEGYAHQDSGNRDCGDGPSACPSGYTFFRADSTPRSATDQNDRSSENVYIVYDAAYGPVVPTGSTYGMVGPGMGSLSAVYYTVLDGGTGTHSAPIPADPPTKQHQLFPDLAVNAGTGHLIWWDSRHDTSCATALACAQQPIGNTADRHVAQQALDVYAKAFPLSGGPTAVSATRLTDVSSNPNFEQFGGRTVPFAGDYLWVDSQGSQTFATWTDWRDTVPGTDARETAVTGTAEPNEGADVLQCRATPTAGDTCPRAGGLDQNIYGDHAP